MTKPRIHLDADTSQISLMRGLIDGGQDVTRTPNEWMALDATDEQQLLGATAERHHALLLSQSRKDRKECMKLH